MPDSVKNILEQKALESIEEVQKWVSVTKDFVIEQSPLVVQEMISWAIAQHTFGIVLSFLLILVPLALYYRYSSKFYVWYEDKVFEHPGPLFSVLGFLASIIIPFIMLCIDTYCLLFVLVAPRLFVIGELARLVGTANGNH